MILQSFTESLLQKQSFQNIKRCSMNKKLKRLKLIQVSMKL